MNGSAAGPASAPERPRRVLLALGALSLAVSLVSLTVWSSDAPPRASDGPVRSPSLSAASPPGSPSRATQTPTPAPPGSPAPNEPWGTLALEPLQPVAELAATRAGPAGVATDTAFTLTSLGRDDPVALARSVVAVPALEMTVTAGTDGRSSRLQPTEALVPGRIYRFTLAASGGTSLGSWAFQVAAPLRVVTTVPYDQATDVPTGTGIEFTFDQDGVLDAASHFSIEPPVLGRFEQHGRTLVFVPEGLEPATLYTVTLASGVSLAGSDQVLEHGVVVRFETAAPAGAADAGVTYRFGRPMVEARTGERPVLALSIWADSNRNPGADKKPFDLAVYRLPTEEAGVEAVRSVATMPEWVRWSTSGLVSTAGLSRIGTFTVQPTRVEGWGVSWVRLPTKLPAGWYLVEVPQPTRAVQMVLQVTDVAAYLAAATDRMLVWANDTADGQPIEGATVELLGGAALGRTDARGLLVATTPAAITSAPKGRLLDERQFLAIRAAHGRSLVVPVGLASVWAEGYAQDQWAGSDPQDVRDRLWRFMATDRRQYRPTDTVNVWGFLRGRDTGRVPGDVEVRLSSSGCCWGGQEQPPISTVPIVPAPTGAFAASIAIADLPYDGYSVQLWAGDEQIAETWIEVSLIRKPAYEIELETDRHVLIAGEPLTLSARTTFFDGTPVPGARLAVDAFGERTATTDRAGVATVRVTASAKPDEENWTQLTVTPTHAEEGDIVGTSGILVFPSSVRLDAEGSVENGRLTVTGSLHEVAVEGLEKAWGTDAWETVDWNARAIGATWVTASIVEIVPVRTKTGQAYDFISKKVVDTYEYRTEEVQRGTKTVRTASDGTFRVTTPANAEHSYRVVLSTADSAGLETRLSVWASAPWSPWWLDSRAPRLEPGCGGDAGRYAIGDPICLTAENDRGPMPAGGSNRYLFFTAQRGLRDTIVGSAPEFRSRFSADDVPNLEIAGAWFTGGAIFPIRGSSVGFDPEGRRLTVSLATDRERYAPGETVTLGVRTTDRTGAPVSASVVLRAVDEKLVAMGAADDPDPLEGLYESVGSWLIWTHASHPLPLGSPGGYGDTTGGGGGGRAVFVDALLFREVTTDADGRAEVSFKLSDDLTSWHVSAAAMTSVPEAGAAWILVPVGLPFFVEATLAPEYLVTDEPVLRLRAFGSGLAEGEPVTFTVTSASLGLPKTTVRGAAFEDVRVALPRLTVGEHAVTIGGSSGTGTAALSDTLTRRFNVVGSRLLGTTTAYTVVATGTRPEGGAGFTDYLFTDAGRGRYVPVLESLAWAGGARVDQALAAVMARDLLVGEFDVDPARLPAATFDSGAYQRGGVGLLPYSSPDLALTARIALLAADRFDRGGLEGAFSNAINDDGSTRERRALAYAGLAGLGRPVLTNLRELAADPGLTIRERLYVALGLAALGDDASALTIERDLLAGDGERRGPWIRLRVGGTLDDTIETTSLLSLLAAGLGDPLADDAAAYVDANPALDELHGLQQVAFVGRMLERTPAEAARFAYTVDGRRTVVDLDPGESLSLRLVESQRRTLSLESLSGRVGMATSWQVPIDREAVARDEELELARTYTPYPSVPDDAMVEVRLTATFGPQVVGGCHQVSDLVPSGLAPLASVQAWPDEGSERSSWVSPYRIEGQRVSFCVGPSKDSRTAKMRYLARIVTPGTYTWESAVIQSASAPESINLTTSRRLTIR